jgi:hypothetical protein
MRPQAGVDRLKPVPPMHANDLPVVGQALSPANRIISRLRERLPRLCSEVTRCRPLPEKP